ALGVWPVDDEPRAAAPHGLSAVLQRIDTDELASLVQVLGPIDEALKERLLQRVALKPRPVEAFIAKQQHDVHGDLVSRRLRRTDVRLALARLDVALEAAEEER